MSIQQNPTIAIYTQLQGEIAELKLTNWEHAKLTGLLNALTQSMTNDMNTNKKIIDELQAEITKLKANQKNGEQKK